MNTLFIIKFGSDRLKTVGRVAFRNLYPHMVLCYFLTDHQKIYLYVPSQLPYLS